MKKRWILLLAVVLIVGSFAGISSAGEIARTKVNAQEKTAGENPEAAVQESQEDDGRIKVACIGDSITAAGYPEALGELLGEEYSVTNFGQPGAQLLSGERFSYTSLDLYQESLDLGADYYFLMLGSNDSMQADAWDPQRFRNEYEEFLDSYVRLESEPQVYVLICPSVFKDEENPRALAYRINLEILNDEICPLLQEIADEAQIPTIDLHSFTADHPEWLADGLHPNEEGNREIAQFIYESVPDLRF